MACVVALSFHTERVAAANYTVSTTNDAGMGSLRDAITQVSAGAGTGDTITITATGTITLGSLLPALAKPVAITGPTSGAGVTVSGGGTVQVFTVNIGVTASIANLTIANGQNSFSACGGISNDGAVTVTNSTLSGNSAIGPSGGGIANNIGTLNLTNTIVAGNTVPISPDINGTVTTTGHNLIGDTSGSSGITGGMNGDIVNPTPLLAALGNYGGATQTVALLPGSPAIDVGI